LTPTVALGPNFFPLYGKLLLACCLPAFFFPAADSAFFVAAFTAAFFLAMVFLQMLILRIAQSGGTTYVGQDGTTLKRSNDPIG
jgi:hypothetical protein